MQIKNFVSLAHTLASVGKVPVGLSHLKIVIKANGLTILGQEVESNVNPDDSSRYDRGLSEIKIWSGKKVRLNLCDSNVYCSL
jgi:hypothetical protein